MAQWLRALAPLPEDPKYSSQLSTTPGDLTPSFWPLRAPQYCGIRSDTYIHTNKRGREGRRDGGEKERKRERETERQRT